MFYRLLFFDNDGRVQTGCEADFENRIRRNVLDADHRRGIALANTSGLYGLERVSANDLLRYPGRYGPVEIMERDIGLQSGGRAEPAPRP
jgi:hypothetical protein